MCGITGWVSFARDLTGQDAGAELTAMTETMACRGPDDQGVWTAPHAALGHRRLAVIDLPGGAQPMSVDTPDGSVAMVYSGETYNFTELRRELQGRGHSFGTESDTEVVLRGYLEWGQGVADRLNGMYAFAIWDARVEQLVMIRDRMGIKPFYFYETDDGVLFGSEPKAILANRLADRRVGTDGLRELFAFTKTPGAAIWSGMSELRPGHVATVGRNGLREQAYWQLGVSEHTDDQATSVAHVRELLDDIIARQLVADVPRCTLLSGGLDSSAMTALAARQLSARGEVVRSFAVDFPNQAEHFRAEAVAPTQDTPYVHAMVDHITCEHSDIMLDGTALADPAVRAAAVGARDFPIGLGDRDNSLYLLFKAIRGESTVALSGESADEVFGGYPWFHIDAERYADTFPWLAKPATPNSPATLLDPGLAARLDIPAYQHDSYRDALAEVPYKDTDTGLEHRMRAVCYFHLTRMVRTLLDRKDRLSMAVGLEVRVPFCDHRLVEYVFNTPWALKTYDGREKSLLRGATRDVLPESVANRVKSGYPGSFDPNYLKAIQEQARELLRTGHTALACFDAAAVRAASDAESATITSQQRGGLERFLDFATWIDLRNPTLETA